MQTPRGPQLMELARRRPLTPAEQTELDAWLARHPEARPPDWEEELALSRLLAALPPAPLSPRFIEHTLAALERTDRPAERVPGAPGWSRLWGRLHAVWRPAVALALLVLALGVWQLQQQRREHGRVTESLVTLAALAEELPDVSALREFDLVLHLPEGPLPDPDTLARALGETP
jgi:hypothetical protein